MLLLLEHVAAELTRALARVGLLGLFKHLGKSYTFPELPLEVIFGKSLILTKDVAIHAKCNFISVDSAVVGKIYLV
jgi:hypothetical protein